MRGTPVETRATPSPQKEHRGKTEPHVSFGRLPGTLRRFAGQGYQHILSAMETNARVNFGGDLYSSRSLQHQKDHPDAA